METTRFEGFSPEAQAFANSPGNIEKAIKLAERCRLDPDILDRLNRRGDEERENAFTDFGVDDPREPEIVFVMNTAQVEHFVIPADPNAALSDEQLEAVAGGGCASSAGSVGTLSSMLTFTSFSTAATAGTIGSAGSAG